MEDARVCLRKSQRNNFPNEVAFSKIVKFFSVLIKKSPVK